MDAFRRNLKLLIASKPLSKRKIAEILDVTHPTITAWETGPAYPQLDQAVMLAEILEVPFVALVFADLSVSPSPPNARAVVDAIIDELGLAESMRRLVLTPDAEMRPPGEGSRPVVTARPLAGERRKSIEEAKPAGKSARQSNGEPEAADRDDPPAVRAEPRKR